MSEEKMRRALEAIAKGCPNPRQVAREALGIGQASSTTVIQLCEATVLCVSIATLLATYNEGKPSASKPMPCCDVHKSLCEEMAEHNKVTVSFRPIAEEKKGVARCRLCERECHYGTPGDVIDHACACGGCNARE